MCHTGDANTDPMTGVVDVYDGAAHGNRDYG